MDGLINLGTLDTGVEKPEIGNVLIEEAKSKSATALPMKRKSLNFMKRNNSTLSNLNGEMSNALISSIGHLDDICLRVKTCLDEITQNTNRYEMLLNLPAPEIQNSSPTLDLQQFDLTGIIDSAISTAENAKTDANQTDEPNDHAEAQQKQKQEQAQEQEQEQEAKEDDKPEIAMKEIEQTVIKCVKIQKREEKRLKVLQNSVAKMPAENKRDRLLNILSYKSLSDKGKLEMVDHLRKRVSNHSVNRKVSSNNVIELPQKNKPKKYRSDDRFSDSLFFKDAEPKKPKLQKNKSTTEVKSVKSVLKTRSKSVDETQQKPATPNSTTTPTPSDDKTDVPTRSEQLLQMLSTRRLAMDSLDKIDQKDLTPIVSEYPRRDNLYYNHVNNMRSTFLYKLTCKNNDRLMRLLVALPENRTGDKQATRPKEEWARYSQQKNRRKEVILEKLRPLIAELKQNNQRGKAISQESNSSDEDSSDSSRQVSMGSLMVDPNRNVQHFQTYTVMPVQITYTNHNTSASTPANKKKLEPRRRVATPIPTPKPEQNSFFEYMSNQAAKADPKRLPYKKLFSHKYKKTTSENLVKYVQQQKTLYENLEKTYSSAQQIQKQPPKPAVHSFPRMNVNHTDTDTDRKFKFDKSTLLNQKYLGKDISRVVGAIEDKIVKVLSSSEDKHDAFEEVEAEIKDILSVMQRMKGDILVGDERVSVKLSTFPLPTLVSVEGSEQSVTALVANESNTIFQKAKTVSNSSTSIDINKSISGNDKHMEAEDYCNEILKQILETKDELRMIQSEEFKLDITKSNSTTKSNKLLPAASVTNVGVEGLDESKDDLENPQDDDNDDDDAISVDEKRREQIEEKLSDVLNEQAERDDEREQKPEEEQEQKQEEEEQKQEQEQEQEQEMNANKSSSHLLTPYFQGLKQYQTKNYSWSTPNILDFLDKLANISTSTKIVWLRKRLVLQVPEILNSAMICETPKISWEIKHQYSSTSWDDAELYYADSTTSYSELEPSVMTPIKGIKTLIDTLKDLEQMKLSVKKDAEVGTEESDEDQRKPPSPRTVISERTVKKSEKSINEYEQMMQVLDQGQRQAKKRVVNTNRARKGPESKRAKTSNKNKRPGQMISAEGDGKVVQVKKRMLDMETVEDRNDGDYGSVLSAIYGVVFSVMYAGLQMNYSCNN